MTFPILLSLACNVFISFYPNIPFPCFYLKKRNKSWFLPESATPMAFQKVFISFLLFSFVLCSRVDSEPTEDRQALLSFLSQTQHSARVQWNSSDSACNWVGVVCDSNRSFVSSLRLPGAGLVGQIPVGTLGLLTQLRSLSLRNNRLSGQLPADFSNLKFLRGVFLQKNLFSGEFPASLTAVPSLARLDLSDNRFSGEIPPSLANLTSLTGLLLNGNGFSGNLPTVDFPSLQLFNVSNNNLSGSIPKSLERFSASSFAGNINLCGGPLVPCNRSSESPVPSPAPSSLQTPSGKSSKKLSKTAIIAISVGGAAVLLLALVLLLCYCCRTSRSRPEKTAAGISAGGAVQDVGNSSSKEEAGGRGEDLQRKKLVFLDGGVYGFDLEDLLRASAEVLGKGSVGTSYKAVMEEGTSVVVKRLKEVAVSQKEFELQMGVLGKVNHRNVVPLKAFYFSKDEKLLISEFMEAGSLSALLHGGRGSGRALLNWDQRLRIALAAGHGLLHLHLSGGIVHGNIKSSNVLLHPDLDACFSDYGLHSLFGTSAPPTRVAGYRAPEVMETRKPTMKSDVYSYGVLLLELLTGKPPNQAAVVGEDGIDLPRWVQSVVREEWMSVVFDAELVKYGSSEEEMVQLLQIAMTCVSTYPDQRPTMEDVIARIEDIEKKLRAIDTLSSDEPSKAPSGSRTPSP